MKKINSVVILTLLLNLLSAATIRMSYSFNEPEIGTNGSYDTVKLEGGMNIGTPGEPSLPWVGSKLYLGSGVETNEIKVVKRLPVKLEGNYNIEPIQEFYPLSHGINPVFTEQNNDIYNDSRLFPYDDYRNLSTQFFAGHSIGYASFSPFEYNPVSGELTYYRSVTVTMETTSSISASNSLALYKDDIITLRRLKNLVDNPSDIPNPQLVAVPNGYEYLMIIDENKVNQWQPLISFYESKAARIEYITVQDVNSNTAGSDLQEKIRNAIINEYTTNNISYVLLCGDTDVIPHRGFYVDMQDDSYTDADIPADIYYGALDGNWNTDGDNYFGENQEVDLVQEVAVGRICYNNDIEIQNAINKILMHQTIPVEDEVETNLMVGEYLWDAPTYGGDYMDEMIGGSSMTGYTTIGIPTSWAIDTIYDRDLGGDGSWGSNTIINAINNGYNYINHLGHSSTTYTMRLSNNHINESNITNDGTNHNFSTLFTQGCYGGAFDNRETSSGYYTDDCITERFQAISTGVVAMLSNSRYGWGSNGSTNGPSQYYHREFIDALFGEGINEVGWAIADAKADVIPFINSATMYWCFYEVNLFGDPGMREWTSTPQTLNIQQVGDITGGSFIANFDIEVPNSSVRILDEGELIYFGNSDDFGMVHAITDQPFLPGQYQLIVEADNYYVSHYNFNVIPSNEAYVTCTSIDFHDEDGIFTYGDVISINIVVENIGTQTTNSDGVVTLTSPSNLIEIANNTLVIDNLTDAQSVTIENAFQVTVVGSFSDLTDVELNFTTSFNNNIANHSSHLTLNAAHLRLSNLNLVSENYFIAPGDDVEAFFTFENSGSAPANNVMIFLMNSSPYLSFSTTDLIIDNIPIDGTNSNTVPINIHVDESCPIDTQIDVNYFAGANGANSIEDVISIYVNSGIFTFEPSEQNFMSYIVTPEFTNQWHRSSERNYTNNGSYSMKYGADGAGEYANSSHAALETMEIEILPESQLKFWHWMQAEDDANLMAWDGGLVQMSVEGGAWQTINPVGNYPYMITDNPASPFDAYQECFSGTFDWQEAVFNLGNTEGLVKFRFVFGSDGYVGGEGWYLDDITIFNRTLGNEEDVQFSTSVNKLYGNYPSPFNPTTTISFSLNESVKDAQIEVFNIRGQKKQTIPLNQNAIKARRVVWEPKELSSGVYFYRLQADGKTISTRKTILMK